MVTNTYKVFGITFLCCLLIYLLIIKRNENLKTLHYLDQNSDTHTLILPRHEVKKLTILMHTLFAEDSFAYTVLGSKPISWASFLNPTPYRSLSQFINSFSKYNRIMRQSWKTWEKYQHHFPQSRLWKEMPNCYPGTVSILIVNENCFNSIVIKHKQDFQKVLNRPIEDGYELLKEAKSCSLMSDMLAGHQALMGIVLGYGRNNSWKFQEGYETRTPIGWVWEEEEYFDDQFRNSNSCLSIYACPSFAGIIVDSVESIALKTHYKSTTQVINDYYAHKDFLEATLSLLAGYRP